MATVDKNFRIKHGLVVEGSTATVNGQNVLTETGSDNYILTLIGGETLVTSVDSTQLEVVSGELAVKANVFDAYGAAATAEQNAKDHADGLAVNYEAAGNISIAINALDTDDIEEGVSNLYFTNQRAIDAGDGVFDGFGAASTAQTNANSYTDTQLGSYTPTSSLDTTVGGYGYLKNADLPTMYSDSDVDAHLSGGDGITYSAGTISADIGTGLEINGSGQIIINRTTVDAWYDASGAANTVAGDLTTHESDTSTHGVTGSIVGTSDTQTLTNKTIGDSLHFQDGVNNYSAIYANADDLKIDGSDDIILTTNSGDIILNPDGHAYLGSATAGNEIATHSYVDNAVSGLNWKQAANLLYNDTTPSLSGDSVTTPLIIDGHTALDSGDVGYRVLVSGGSDAGIYVYNQTGTSWTLDRAADADAFGELIGAAIFIMEGTTYGGSSWVQANHYITDFTNQDWTQFSGSGTVTAGNGITVNGLEVSIDDSVVVTETDLTTALGDKQDTLTASTGITIDGSSNISVTANTYDAYGAAAQALSDAEDYADGLAGNYDASGTAAGLVDDLKDGTTPFTLLNVNDQALQIAASTTSLGSVAVTAYQWAKADYRSGKFLVKIDNATDNEISEILVTLDSSDNVAITEYAIVGTNGSRGSITADVSGSNVRIRVNPVNDSTIKITGTLLK